MRKDYWFIRRTYTKSGKLLVLWQIGNYKYQIDEKKEQCTPIATIDGSIEDATDVLYSLAAIEDAAA